MDRGCFAPCAFSSVEFVFPGAALIPVVVVLGVPYCLHSWHVASGNTETEPASHLSLTIYMHTDLPQISTTVARLSPTASDQFIDEFLGVCGCWNWLHPLPSCICWCPKPLLFIAAAAESRQRRVVGPIKSACSKQAYLRYICRCVKPVASFWFFAMENREDWSHSDILVSLRFTPVAYTILVAVFKVTIYY